MNRIENNQVVLSGEIVDNFEFSHEVYGEKFYKTYLSSERRSGIKDTIIILISERLVDVEKDWLGQIIRVNGQYRSFNKCDEENRHTVLSVFVRDLEVWEDDGTEERKDENTIFLDGYICKKPVYRTTPFGREITEVLLAVNRPYAKSDYIPCIIWGRNARFASGLEVGTRLKLWGRVQSREYIKKISETDYDNRVTYEVSVSMLEVAEDE